MLGVIPTRVHGVIDYVVGIALLAAPWLFQFDDNRDATLVPVAVGLAILLYSLLTDYELGVAKLIPMPAHLGLDVLGGIVLIASPWVLDFTDDVWWPHVVVGAMELLIVLLSSSQPHELVAETRQSAPRGRS